MTQFYLVRHGEPQWSINEERQLIASRRDLVPLTATGIREVEEAVKDPRLSKGEIIVSSPYTRAMHTAALLNRELNLPFAVEYDLHEWIPDLTMQYSSYEEFQAILLDFQRSKGIYPEGETRRWESLEAMHQRLHPVLLNYLDYEHVIVVCHGMVIESLAEVKDVPHAGIVELTLER